jgi:protein TonB
LATPDPAATGGATALVVAAPPAATPQDGAASPAVVAISPAGAPGATARVQLPSSNAEYLHNPKPVYPPISRRLGEQGTVLVNVLIGVDGTAHSAEIKKSSGFDRLDQSALAMVLKWRYTPGKRAGVPEAMWFTVPIPFVLE